MDFDATTDDINAVVIPHFRGVRDAFDASRAFTYKLGVYGTRNVCSVLAAEGLTDASFVSDMSTGYSGNLGFTLPANWAYDQIDTDDFGGGSGWIEVDKVVASSRAVALAANAVRTTPRIYAAGQPVGFDETFFWRIAGLGYLSDSCSNDIAVGQSARDDFILNWLQKPEYWTGPTGGNLGTIWATVYTPSLATQFPNNYAAASVEFEVHAGSDLFPKPSSTGFRDMPHWAAATRGYTQWGVPTAGTLFQYGDIGAWAGDLITFWISYEEARLAAPGGVLDVRTWTAATLGTESPSRFSKADLVADMAGYLTAHDLRVSPGSGCLEDAVRGLLVTIQANPAQLALDFKTRRFGSRASMVAAAKDAWVSPWLPGFVRSQLLDGIREPGQPAPVQSPPQSILDTELDGLANGFADAVEAAVSWTSI